MISLSHPASSAPTATMNSRRPQTTKSSADDEVNQLLQSAQDELLLNLSVNSHTVSNSDLDPDLSRRLLALKSRPSSVPTPAPAQKPQTSAIPTERVQVPVDDELKEVLGDDLSARFAALRGTLPSDSSITRPSPSVDHSAMEVELEDEEDEVEKILRWAKDAARLDPSPPSDDEVDDDDDDDDDVSSSESDSDVVKKKEKGKSRKQK